MLEGGGEGAGDSRGHKASEVPEPLAGLLRLIDERHEALVRRIEDSVHQALSGHFAFEKAMDSLYKMKTPDEVSVSGNGNGTQLDFCGHVLSKSKQKGTCPNFAQAKPAVALTNTSGQVSNTQAKPAVASMTTSEQTVDRGHADAIDVPSIPDREAQLPTIPKQEPQFPDTTTLQSVSVEVSKNQEVVLVDSNDNHENGNDAAKSSERANGKEGEMIIAGDRRPVPKSPGEPLSPTAVSTSSRNSRSKASPHPLGLRYSNTYARVSTIEMEILEGRGLLAMDRTLCGRASDPYVKVIDSEQGEVFRTRIIKKTVDPVWNAICKFEIDEIKTEIILEVWDEDLGDDELIGRVRLHASEVAGGSIMRWFDIQAEDDCPKATGKILLKVSMMSIEKGNEETAYFRLQRWCAEGEFKDDNEGNQGDQGTAVESSSVPCVSALRELVASKRFDAFFCSFIVFNAVTMLCELEYNGRKSMSSIGLSDTSNKSEALELIFKGLNYFFTGIFVIELIMRFGAWGLRYLKKPANWLDIVIVAGSVLDVVDAASFINLTFLRLIRLTKLTRLLKAAMMTNFCEPLRVLMKAISTSFGSVVWSFLLLAMIEIVAALFMTQVLADTIYDESLELDTRKFVYIYYGTTSRTTLTMFQITMAPGTFGALGRPIIEEVSPIFAWFYIGYVGLVSFTVVRIIAALFLRQTMQVAVNDDQQARNAKVRLRRQYSEGVRDAFSAAEEEGTGHVTLDQFQKFFMSATGQEWLHELDLNDKDAVSIFQLVCDGDGRLTLDEFLGGVFRLKDTTKQIDIVVLQHEAKKIKKIVSNLLMQVDDLSFWLRRGEKIQQEDEIQQPPPNAAHFKQRSSTAARITPPQVEIMD